MKSRLKTVFSLALFLTVSSAFALDGTWTFSEEVGSYKITKYGPEDLEKIYGLGFSVDDERYKFSNGEMDRVKKIVILGNKELLSYEEDFTNGYFEDSKFFDFLNQKGVVEFIRIEGEKSEIDCILADGDLIMNFGGIFVVGKTSNK